MTSDSTLNSLRFSSNMWRSSAKYAGWQRIHTNRRKLDRARPLLRLLPGTSDSCMLAGTGFGCDLNSLNGVRRVRTAIPDRPSPPKYSGAPENSKLGGLPHETRVRRSRRCCEMGLVFMDLFCRPSNSHLVRNSTLVLQTQCSSVRCCFRRIRCQLCDLLVSHSLPRTTHTARKENQYANAGRTSRLWWRHLESLRTGDCHSSFIHVLLCKSIGCGDSRAFGLFRNCLLYTSPSPRDKRQSRMPSSA